MTVQPSLPQLPAGSPEKGEQKTRPAENPDPKQLAETASKLMQSLTAALLFWPAGVISGFGAMVTGIAVWSQVWVGGRLDSTEYVATLVVGAVLTVVGPIVAGGSHAGAQRVVKTFLEEKSVPQSVKETEARATHLLGVLPHPDNGG
jgi:hypothetical protein